MWDLIFLVFVLFIAVPCTWAVIDEYRWHRTGQHKVRRTDLILTARKDAR